MSARFSNLFFSLLFLANVLLNPREANAQNPPTAYFTVSDSMICPGVPINFFDQSSDNPTSYSWFFPGASSGDTSSVQNPTGIIYNHPGAYDVTLIVSNQYGSDTITKLYYIQVKGNFYIKPDTNVYKGSTVTLYAGGGSTYFWNPGGSISDNMTVKVDETTVYQCTVYDPLTSCTFNGTVTVWIIYDFLFVANTFHPTPDFPQIAVHGGTGIENLQSLHWSIYDRWGEKVFESTDVNMDVNQTGWNGTYLGKQCGSGVYVYTLTVSFIDGETWAKSGNITLIR